MMNHHLEIMDVLGTKASAVTYSGAVASVGSGALVIFGLPVGQVEIAFVSMLIGAFIGIGGLIANIVFKWLAHKEMCRMNDAKKYKTELKAELEETK